MWARRTGGRARASGGEKASTTADASEAAFADGSLAVRWVEIPDAGDLTEAQLESASDAVGAAHRERSYGRPPVPFTTRSRHVHQRGTLARPGGVHDGAGWRRF
jgi:hypothetical protein